MSEPAEQMIGRHILDFEVVSVVGQGGMSVVFAGRHRVTGQKVAIKMLPNEGGDEFDDTKKRFVDEARVLALMDHPNIVTLNNFVESRDGSLCLVMQFAEGATLEDLIQRRKLNSRESVRILIEVLKALEYAHARNIVHRDIKPANIIVREDGAVKVTDFGIAKLVGASGVTRAGQAIGTATYMAPEQVMARPVDARCDIYALGITLHETLTGKPPFDGATSFEVLEHHLKTPPPPLENLDLGVSPALSDVVLRALAKLPADRFPSAASFREALEKVPEANATAAATVPLRQPQDSLRITPPSTPGIKRVTPSTPPRAVPRVTPSTPPRAVPRVPVEAAAADSPQVTTRPSSPRPEPAAGGGWLSYVVVALIGLLVSGFVAYLISHRR